ncbi:outer membrane beta-barrel protein [Belliella aquatica]|nr:outer membrane beta-barrel protein [Belliella aquatica]
MKKLGYLKKLFNFIFMKKLFLVIAFLSLGFISNAQTEKGKFLLGAGTSFSVGESNGYMSLGSSSSTIVLSDGTTIRTKNSSVNFAPKVGYFFIDNFAAGLDFAAFFSKGENDQIGNTSKNKTNQFAIGPFARYYFSGKKIKPFLEVNSLFGVRNQESEVGATTIGYKYSITNVGGGLGMAILIGERSALDILASYNSFTINENEDNPFSSKLNNIGIKVGFTIFLK